MLNRVAAIAHRLATIIDYDKVVVLDKGELQQFGPPATLLKDTGGIFYSLVRARHTAYHPESILATHWWLVLTARTV
jgi:ABC-type multidrug transport system fused ATPase/permease subunit